MFARLPLHSLRAFESAARLGSFKQAANELSVTPAAISQQIKQLETQLGLVLFQRESSGVSLTEQGKQLFHDTHQAFTLLQQGVNQLEPGHQPDKLTLTTMPAFASHWLIPRLNRFYQRHPGLHVTVNTTNDLVDLARDASIDIAIRCTDQHFPQLRETELMSDRFHAYSQPGYLARQQQDMESIELIDLHLPEIDHQINWATWCQQAGHDNWLQQAVFHAYNDEHHALQAALCGQGMVLASNVFVADAMAQGLLDIIHPNISLPGARFVALCVPGKERQPAVNAFLHWLEEEVGLFTQSQQQPS